MSVSGYASPKVGGICTQRLGQALRHRFPTKTAEHVAAALGAPVRTVEKWLDGTASPSLTWFGIIVIVFGPTFLAEIMTSPPAWLDAAARAERLAQLEAENNRIRAEIEALRGPL